MTSNGEDPLDGIVIGAGISGLTAAWRLRHRRIAVIEATDRVGGRLASHPSGEYWLNLGAHLFPPPGSVIDGLLNEFGLRAVPVRGTTTGLAVGDRKLTSGSPTWYPLRLDLDLRERAAFSKAGLKLRQGLVRYTRIAAQREGESLAEAADRLLRFMSTQSFAEFLGPLPERVAAIFKAAANRATAEPDELSAGAGIGLFALVWRGRSSGLTRNLIGGSALLPEAIAGELGDRMRLSATATTISNSDVGCTVCYQQCGEARTLDARHVVIAVPPPDAARLVRDVAPPAAERLDGIRCGPFVSMAVRTSETRPMPWDGTYAMATPGRAFSMFFNHAQVLRSGPRKAGGSLMVYAGGHDAGELLRASDDDVRARFTPDLESLYPELRSIIVETKVARFPVGNTFGSVGRQAVQPLAEPLGQHRNIHLAGDYFAELGSMEKAARSGLEAAKRVEAR